MKTRLMLAVLAPWFLLSCGGGGTPGQGKDTGTDPGWTDSGLDLSPEESVSPPPTDPGSDAVDGRDEPDTPVTDVPPQQGQPGWPCKDNAECLSGW